MNTLEVTAKQTAVAGIMAVRPQWSAVRCARDAVGLQPMSLLHAGPPYADPRRPPAPVLSSAMLCCLYEGWARDSAHAQQLIESGAVILHSAQSYEVVVPLAGVVSPATALVEISDGEATPSCRRAWSLLGSGSGPQIRFGSLDMAILPRLRWRDTVLARALHERVSVDPIDLFALARIGLKEGDDLHARTTNSTAALHTRLSDSLLEASVDQMLRETPLFFLTLWMAACHLLLGATVGVPGLDSTVIAMAGNGVDVGIRLAGRPSAWSTLPASAPQGPRNPDKISAAAVGLVGDSGVIDAMGFGAHALAPELSAALAAWLPTEEYARQARLFSTTNPVSEELRCLLDARRVLAEDLGPAAAIAMIAADGRGGLLGRGVYRAPPALFAAALDGLNGTGA